MIEQIHTVVSCVKQLETEEATQETTGKKRNKSKHTPVCYRVCFNTGLEVCFSADEVYEYHFYEEAALRHPFETIMSRILFRRLLTGVLPFVVFTRRTEYQVLQRAEQVPCGTEPVWKQFKTSALDLLLDYLRREQYVDDMRYAQVYVRNQKEKAVSRLGMFMELTKRGISKELAEQAVSEGAPDEKESARKLLLKKLGTFTSSSGQSMSAKEKGKLYRFLAGKGFSGETIRQVMSEYAIKDDGGDLDASV